MNPSHLGQLLIAGADEAGGCLLTLFLPPCGRMSRWGFGAATMENECQHPDCQQLRIYLPEVSKMLPLLEECLRIGKGKEIWRWGLPDSHLCIREALRQCIRAIENPLVGTTMGCSHCQRRAK